MVAEVVQQELGRTAVVEYLFEGVEPRRALLVEQLEEELLVKDLIWKLK